LEKALTTWKDKYCDIINLEEDLEISNFCSPRVRIPFGEMQFSEEENVAANELKKEKISKCLTRPESNAPFIQKIDEDWVENDSKRFFDQYLDAENNDDHEGNYLEEQDEQYFEVSSATPKRRNSAQDKM